MPAENDPDIDAIARIGAVPTILKLITELTGLRLALVARVTDEDWKACAVHDALGFGLSTGDHLVVATTLCSEVRDARAPVVIEHASVDPLYSAHPTPKMYGFESYVSVPIFLDGGVYFGNVCGLDAKPLPLVERRAEAILTVFAKLIALQLDADHRAAVTQRALLDERETAELREQFIAVLGHDLRGPLSAIMMGAELLQSRRPSDADLRVVTRIRASGQRMSRLIDDVLDFARGRLGGGIGIEQAPIADVGAVFQQVVDEQRVAHPGRLLNARIADVGALRGDRDRLAQLLANLVGNALEHGIPSDPVEVLVEPTETALLVSVSNRGEPIPEDVIPRLFQPYVRGPASAPRTGLGLGLYIVAEIARSHGGGISVTSTAERGTTFRCTLPRNL